MQVGRPKSPLRWKPITGTIHMMTITSSKLLTGRSWATFFMDHGPWGPEWRHGAAVASGGPGVACRQSHVLLPHRAPLALRQPREAVPLLTVHVSWPSSWSAVGRLRLGVARIVAKRQARQARGPPGAFGHSPRRRHGWVGGHRRHCHQGPAQQRGPRRRLQSAECAH